MKKLILYLFFAFSAIISMAQTRFDVNNLTYEILSESDRTVEVHDCNDNVSGDLSIPASISYNEKTYTVASIGEEAFALTELTAVTIPSSVRSIGKWAFSGCDRLMMINVESGNNYYKSIDGVV